MAHETWLKAKKAEKLTIAREKLDPTPKLPHQAPNTVRFLHISDTPGWHSKLKNLPSADIIIHSGDFCRSLGFYEEVKDFSKWFASLANPHKIVIAGNHEMTFDLPNPPKIRNPEKFKNLSIHKSYTEVKALVSENPNFIY